MPVRFFVVLLAGRAKAPGWLLLAAVALTVVCLMVDVGGWAPLPWLLCGIPLIFLLGSVEPTLVVLVCAEVGVIWVGNNPWHFGAGAAVATAIAYFRLQEHRGCSTAATATIGGLLCVAVLGLMALRPFIILPAAAAVVLAPFGMDILLPEKIKSGCPRLTYLLGGVWVFVFMFFVQVVLILLFQKLLRMPAPSVRRFGGRGIRGLFRFFPYGRYDRIGIRPLDEPCIVVSNHQSSVDIPIILSLPSDVRLTLSRRVWDAPWLGISARKTGHVLADENILERSKAVMKEGASVHFFPEGTRSHDGYPARFHRGAFELAVQLKCDVVPVVLCDTRTCVPRDAYWVENFHMSMRMLDRIPPGDDSRALQKKVQAIVRETHAEELKRINTPKQLRRKVLRRYRYMGWRAYFGVRRELMDTEHCGYGARIHWRSEQQPGERFTGTDPDPKKIAIARRSAAGKPRVTFETR